jgi:hypothetical protein
MTSERGSIIYKDYMRNLQNQSYIVHFFVLLLLFFYQNQAMGACGGACSSDSDCSANACHYCDTDFGLCQDCCEFVDSFSCPSPACTWTGSECRNNASLSCTGLAETPKTFWPYFYLLLFGGLLFFAWWGRKRRVKIPVKLDQ